MNIEKLALLATSTLFASIAVLVIEPRANERNDTDVERFIMLGVEGFHTFEPRSCVTIVQRDRRAKNAGFKIVDAYKDNSLISWVGSITKDKNGNAQPQRYLLSYEDYENDSSCIVGSGTMPKKIEV